MTASGDRLWGGKCIDGTHFKLWFAPLLGGFTGNSEQSRDTYLALFSCQVTPSIALLCLTFPLSFLPPSYFHTIPSSVPPLSACIIMTWRIDMHYLVLFFTIPCSLQHFIKHNCQKENIYYKKFQWSANQLVQNSQLQNSKGSPMSPPALCY